MCRYGMYGHLLHNNSKGKRFCAGFTCCSVVAGTFGRSFGWCENGVCSRPVSLPAAFSFFLVFYRWFAKIQCKDVGCNWSVSTLSRYDWLRHKVQQQPPNLRKGGLPSGFVRFLDVSGQCETFSWDIGIMFYYSAAPKN